MSVHDHPERTRAVARGDQAERLVSVALDLAMLVRDEGPEAIGSFLGRLTGGDRYRLLTILAAMVPVDDMSEAEMLAWVTFDEFGQPLPAADPVLPVPRDDEEPATPYEDCGTLQGFYRHARAGQKTADAEACGCAQAYRDHRNARHAANHGGADAVAARKNSPAGNREAYARHRAEGATIGQAAEWMGIHRRTADRYEEEFRDAGQAPWREKTNAA